jgi:hypothetical protein
VTDAAVVGDPKGDVFGDAAETARSPATGNARIVPISRFVADRYGAA